MKAWVLGLIYVATASAAVAADVPVETATLGKAAITLHLHPFLTDEELATLRLVMTNEQALALFVPGQTGFAALAASPDDGFIREGKPVASAVALADMADQATAASAAIAACEKAKTGPTACVLLLEVAPGK